MAKCKTTAKAASKAVKATATKKTVAKCAPKAASKATPKKSAARPAKKRVTFALTANAGSKVFVAGDFNNWDPTATPLTDKKTPGEFVATVSIPSGTYEYKFVINGCWQVDTNNKEWVQNSLGTLNSVLRVE